MSLYKVYQLLKNSDRPYNDAKKGKIGITKNIRQRMTSYFFSDQNRIPIKEGVYFEILHEFEGTKSEAILIEEQFQKQYGVVDGLKSEEVRKKMSTSSFGKLKSQKHRESCSKAQTGRKDSAETVEKRASKLRKYKSIVVKGLSFKHINEAAEHFKKSSKTIRRWIESNKGEYKS